MLRNSYSTTIVIVICLVCIVFGFPLHLVITVFRILFHIYRPTSLYIVLLGPLNAGNGEIFNFEINISIVI